MTDRVRVCLFALVLVLLIAASIPLAIKADQQCKARGGHLVTIGKVTQCKDAR